jgi:hypothetical protein
MPKDCNAFDLDSFSDVIIKLNYTAAEGGDILREKTRSEVITPAQENLARCFSLRHEFPNEWFRFIQPSDQTATSQTQERFPFQLRGKQLQSTTSYYF